MEPGEPKDPDTSTVFQLWQAFATDEQTAYMRQEFANGIAWGEAKKQLFELINDQVKDARERYEALMADPAPCGVCVTAGRREGPGLQPAADGGAAQSGGYSPHLLKMPD